MCSMKRFILAVLLLLGLCGVNGDAQANARDPEACRDLGFVSSQLQCALCDVLRQHTGSASLYEECMSCCRISEDDNAAEPRYSSARIEYKSIEWLRDTTATQTELHTLVQKFLDKAPYKDVLQFRESPYTRLPKLVLLTDDGAHVEVQIESWRAFEIDEFLRKKLTQV